MDKKSNIKRRAAAVGLTAAAIAVLLVIEALIETAGTRHNANDTSNMLMDQIISVMKQNEEDESELMDALKEDYIVRAQAVSYILSNNSGAAEDIKTLGKIARLMSVDELHIFDESGTIVGGTVPKYYGLRMDDGEQVAYFKPMLDNKMLTMCQDVTPNTAEGKSMMYAMVWNDDGTMMIQVGIEPVRLLNEVKANSISEVIKGMPMYDGVEIFVADNNSREILGSTDLNLIGKNIDEIGLAGKPAAEDSITDYTLKISGSRSYCAVKQYGDKVVLISQKASIVNRGLYIGLLVVFVYLCITVSAAAVFITRMSNKVELEREKRLEQQELLVDKMKQQMSIIQAVSREFTDIIIIDPENAVAAMVKKAGKLVDADSLSDIPWKPYADTWQSHIERFVLEEDAPRLSGMVRLENVLAALKKSDEYVCSYRMLFKGRVYHYQVKFVNIAGEDGSGASIVASFQNIDEILLAERRRAMLEKKVNTDELTGLYNRAAYEEAIQGLSEVNRKDFAVIAMDVNGLKTVNDTLGHEAGDELIKGAAFCMERCFAKYGRIYRTGGDEFFALVNAGDSEIQRLLTEFENRLSEWSGKLVSEVSVSYGAASVNEFPGMSPLELAREADGRMYKYKERYYYSHGIDRIGQQTSLKAVCESYIKVLKVNLTEDICLPFRLDKPQNGENDSYSAMVADFLGSGLISDEDAGQFAERMNLDSLRRHFGSGNSSFCIYYRRLIGGEYKRVMLEMTPAPEYSEENRVVFLFVKNIEP